MSNFFESLEKAHLIEAGEFAPPASDPPTRSQPVEQVAPEPEPSSSHSIPFAFRRVGLKVSALSPIFPFTEETRSAAEQYRIIRTKILHHPRRPKVIVVSSGDSGDGKTISSINLASSFALKQDGRVALVDANLRKPQISKLLGIVETPGLGEVLAGVASFGDAAVTPEEFPNLCILPAGEPRATQAELLDSLRWRALIDTLRQNFEHVICDAPAMDTVTDYDLVQQVSDGVVLIARPDHSQRKLCLKALQTIPQEKLIGVILNCVEHSLFWRSHRSYNSPQ